MKNVDPKYVSIELSNRLPSELSIVNGELTLNPSDPAGTLRAIDIGQGKVLDRIGKWLDTERVTRRDVSPAYAGGGMFLRYETDEEYRPRLVAAVATCRRDVHVLGIDQSTWHHCQCGKTTTGLVPENVPAKPAHRFDAASEFSQLDAAEDVFLKRELDARAEALGMGQSAIRGGTKAAIIHALMAVNGVRRSEVHDHTTRAWMRSGEIAVVVAGDFDREQLARVIVTQLSLGVRMLGSQHRSVRIDGSEYTASWHTPGTWAMEETLIAALVGVGRQPDLDVIDGMTSTDCYMKWCDNRACVDRGGEPMYTLTSAQIATGRAIYAGDIQALVKATAGESADAAKWRDQRRKEKRQVRQVMLDCSEDL